jgi:DUF4097 and DUF4098 domain-containing protein YvlB
MASSVQNVPPPILPRPRRSLAGPVVLILVGIVFLLGTMGVLHWYMLFHWFGQYWPLLIILWGIIKLVEHQQAQRTGTRATGITAGGVFLLTVLIFFGLIATHASRFNWEELRDQMNMGDRDFPLFGHTYNYDDQQAQNFPGDGALHVVDDRGAVSISASSDDQIHVIVHKRISAESQGEADKWNSGTKPEITVSGNVVTLTANTHRLGDHWVTADLDVSLPRKAGVVVSTRHGDVSVLGRNGDVSILSQHGEVSVSDIKGKVSLNLDHSSARVSQIGSGVTVEGRAEDISLEDIKGEVHLSGDFTESLKLARITKPVTFKSSRTTMEFARLDGELSLDSGDLQASNVIGPVRLETRAKDVRLRGVSGDLRLRDENGAVEVHMSKVGTTQVDNRQGDIQIFVPDKAKFQLNAHARNGEIQTDFGELKVNNSNDEAVASGAVGGGGPQLALTNEHGTIEIRKGSTEAEMIPNPRAPQSPTPPAVPDATEN